MFVVTREPIDAEAWSRRIEDPAAGAVATFEGRVRDHADGREVTSLAYEAYDVLAVTEGERILAEARARFAIRKAACVHRAGHLSIGERAVWVGASAAHRDAAFEACRYLIDELKRRVPIWKKETYADGASEWVAAFATPASPGSRT